MPNTYGPAMLPNNCFFYQWRNEGKLPEAGLGSTESAPNQATKSRPRDNFGAPKRRQLNAYYPDNTLKH